MTAGNYLRIAGYTFLCGMLFFLVPMQPLALQPILRVPQDYPTIQAAANAAPEGATILIGPGTYEESIIITKSLTLEGSGIDSTILRPPVSPPENPVLTVQAPERVVALRVRQLTVGSQAQTYQGVGIQVLTDASLVLERSAWVNLWTAISATGSLQRLEAQDSLFEHNHVFISIAHERESVMQEVILKRNRFTKGATVSAYDSLLIDSLRLIIHDNTVICDPGSFLIWPHSQVGMAFGVAGQAEIARNSVALCEQGLIVLQGLKGTSVTIRDNWLLNNNHNLLINEIPDSFFLLGGGVIDWLIEGNTIIGGGIGIKAYIHNAEGGRVRLFNNQIAWQRTQHLGIGTPRDISYFGNGILLFTSLRRENLKEPLQIEISENQIEGNEAWGLALNLAPGLEGQPDRCNVYAPGEEQIFTDLEITGSGNVFHNNGKGDLCPPDYPWPPGFRK